MSAIKKYTFLAVAILASISTAAPSPDSSSQLAARYPHARCGTCDPHPGQNRCDITTSCINTGSNFHCACRAGYKAGNGEEFRIQLANFEFLVFVPGGQTCDVLCDNPFGFGPNLCSEVPLLSKKQCPP